MGPTFGNWTAGEHGFLGLTIHASATGIYYGYAEINVNADYSITLLSMAYNDVQGAAITTVSSVPEPSTMALMGLAAACLAVVRRRASRR